MTDVSSKKSGYLPYQPYVGAYPVYSDKPQRHPYEIPWLIVAITVGAVVFILALRNVFHDLAQSVDYSDSIPAEQSPLGSIVLFILLMPVLLVIGRGLMWGGVRNNAIEITSHQFPEVYGWIVDIAQQFKLKEIPKAYVVLGNGVINAFSSGHCYRRYIAIYSDLFEVSGQVRNPDAVKFILAHEMGHIAAGHTSYWRQVFTASWMQIPVFGSTLSRAQEYTADNHGYAYSPQGAAGVVQVLGAGKHLHTQVDPIQVMQRAEVSQGFFAWLANALSSHPVLTWRAHALYYRDVPGALLWKPKPRTAQLLQAQGPQAS